MSRYLGSAVISVIMLGLASSVFAADVYDNEADFLANVLPGYYLEDFSAFSPGPAGPSVNFGPVNGYSYTISAVDELYTGSGVMSTNIAFDSLHVDFTGDPVTAVGGNFWTTDIDFFVVDGTLVLDLSDGTQETVINPTPATFRGFTSGEPFSSIEIAPSDAGGPTAWATIDNLYVGSLVPEPGTLALLGLVGLVAARRRR